MKALALIILTATFGLMDAAAHAAVLPNGGAVCKNTSTEPGSCTLLSVDCAGTYTETRRA